MKEFSSSQVTSVEVDLLDDFFASCHGPHAAKIKHELAHGLALSRGAVQHA